MALAFQATATVLRIVTARRTTVLEILESRSKRRSARDQGMAYLLIVPTGLYIALAISILRRQPSGFAHLLLACYVLNTALVTAAYLVVGTAFDPAIVTAAEQLTTFFVHWNTAVVLPLVLLGLYFGERVRSRRAQFIGALVGGGPMLFMLPLVVMDGERLAELSPFPDMWLLTTQRGWGTVLLQCAALLTPTVGVIAVALWQRRAMRRDLMVLLATCLFGLLAFSLGASWGEGSNVAVITLGTGGAVGVLTCFVLRISTVPHSYITAETLSVLAGLLTTHSLHDALLTLLEQLRDIVPYDRASVLLETSPGVLGVYAFKGFLDPGTYSPEEWRKTTIRIADYPYLQRIFQDGAPQLVRDTASDPTWKSMGRPYGSWLGVPLSFRGHVLGCLSIVHHRPYFFTETHMQLALAFANQAVIAVENVRLFEAEQRRRRHAEFLWQASYALATSPDLSNALHASLERLAQVLDFHHAYIGLVDMEQGVWISPVNYPEERAPSSVSPPPIGQYPLLDDVLIHQHAVLIHDTRKDPRWIPDVMPEPETRSWIGVPLVARNRVIGAIGVHSLQPHSFSQEEFQIVRVFANQIAATLDNFRLLEEFSHQNQALTALNTILAASNEALSARDDVLHVSLVRVLEALELAGGVIHQYIPAEHHLRLRVAEGLPPAVVEALSHVHLDDENALSLPPLTLPEAEGLTFLSVPLLSHGATIGLLSVVPPAGQAAASSLREWLESIGQQLGVVMDNAILFEATTSRAALSADLSRVGLAISAQLDRETVLNLLCTESAAALGVQGAYIWLLKNKHLEGVAAYGPGAEAFIGHSLNLDEAQSLPVQVLREWRPRYINHVERHDGLPDFFLEQVHARAALAVPLLKADVLVGTMLLVETEQPDAFEDWVLEQVGVLGVQAALTLQNAALFEEVRHRLEQLRLVNELSRYTTVLLNLPHLLEGIAQMLSMRLHYDLVALLDANPQQLSVHTVFCRGEIVGAEVLHGPFMQLAGQARRDATSVQKNVHSVLPPVGNIVETEEESVFCARAVPLIIADEVTGVLLVARQGADSITPNDTEALMPLAAQVAISISNARLYEKVRQQTVVLEERVAQRTAEIRHQQERTEAILRSVADAVIVFDLKGQVMLTNPAARTLFDAHDLEMDLGTRVREMVLPLLREDYESPSTTEMFELGTVTLQAKAARVMEGDHTLGVVVVMRDISRLRELDRMKDMFVTNVSHELRTPLANLKLYMALLEQGRPERRAKYLDVMHREIERLERLITNLLQISRLTREKDAERPPTRVSVDLQELVETVVQNNSARAVSEGKLLRHERLTPKMPPYVGDPDQIVRALTNLVSNALSYTQTGGQIVVRSRLVALEPDAAEWAMIEVVDDGIGIPEHELPSIFERFYRASNVSPNIAGTGLGLAIVKEIVELHGGRIEVESQKNIGSTFRIWLPFQLPPTEQDAIAAKRDEVNEQ